MAQKLFQTVLPALLRPIVRFCIKHSVPIRELMEGAKVAYLSEAQAELKKRGEPISISSIALITGMHRVEIPKMLARTEATPAERPNVLSKVISSWESSKRYRTKSGAPKVLTVDGWDSEFYELSWATSQSLNPLSVLKELQRLGLVSVSKQGAKLIKSSAVPAGEAERAYEVLSNDFLDLYETVDEGIDAKGGPYDHHIRTEYDNVYAMRLPEIRDWLQREGERFHARLRKFLAARDKDVTPSETSGEAGCRVAFTSFSHTNVIKKLPEG